MVFGVTGFGAALVSMPLATHLVPLGFALALYALADIANSFSVGLEKPRNAVRAEYLRLVPMILVGTAAGVTVLVNLPRAAGMLLLGSFVIAYAIYALLPARVPAAGVAQLGVACRIRWRRDQLAVRRRRTALRHLPSQRGLSKEEFRATLGLVTMTSISLRVVAFLLTGLLLDPDVWRAALVVVPAALAGIWLREEDLRQPAARAADAHHRRCCCLSRAARSSGAR